MNKNTYLLMVNDRIDFKHSDYCEFSLGGHNKSFNTLEDLISFTFYETVPFCIKNGYEKKDLNHFIKTLINEYVTNEMPEENQEEQFNKLKKDLIESINSVKY